MKTVSLSRISLTRKTDIRMRLLHLTQSEYRMRVSTAVRVAKDCDARSVDGGVVLQEIVKSVHAVLHILRASQRDYFVS